MLGQVVVHLVSGETIACEVYEMDEVEVQKVIQRFLEAEGQGSFVLDCGEYGWTCTPTRSIEFFSVYKVKPDA